MLVGEGAWPAGRAGFGGERACRAWLSTQAGQRWASYSAQSHVELPQAGPPCRLPADLLAQVGTVRGPGQEVVCVHEIIEVSD